VPAHAADCHVWAPTPGTNVAAATCAVGTTQLTSPASLEAEMTVPDRAVGTFSGPGARTGPSRLFFSSSANFSSSGGDSKPPALWIARESASARVSFGTTLE